MAASDPGRFFGGPPTLSEVIDSIKNFSSSVGDKSGIKGVVEMHTNLFESLKKFGIEFGSNFVKNALAAPAGLDFDARSTFNGKLAPQIFGQGNKSRVEEKQLAIMTQTRDLLRDIKRQKRGLMVGSG